MILTTHIMVGGAVASPFVASGNLPAAFLVALASHYMIDAIPHWSFRMNSINLSARREERTFKADQKKILLDLGKVFIDVLVGVLLLFLFSPPTFSTPGLTLFGLIIVGAILPDALQGIQLVYKGFPVNILQRFHDFFHYDNGGVGDLPLTFGTFFAQLLIVLFALAIIVTA